MPTPEENERIRQRAIKTIKNLHITDASGARAAVLTLAYLESLNGSNTLLAIQKNVLWDMAHIQGVSNSEFNDTFNKFLERPPRE